MLAGVLFPPLFERALGKSHFWKRYASPAVRVPGSYEELVGLPIEHVTREGVGLAIGFQHSVPRPWLYLVAGGQRHAIADPDHEQVLRGPELEVFALHAALVHGVRHPGVILALLSRFAPIVDADGAARVHLIDRALKRVPLLTVDAPSLWARIDYRGAQLAWVQEGSRWLLTQPVGVADAMNTWPSRRPRRASLRTADNEVFPHAELDNAVSSARREVEDLVAKWRIPPVVALARRFADGDRAVLPAFVAALADLGMSVSPDADGLDAAWLVELILDAALGSITKQLVGKPPRESPVQWSVTMVSFQRDVYERAAVLAAARGFQLHDEEQVTTVLGLRGSLDDAIASLRDVLRRAGVAPGSMKFCVGDLATGRWIDV